MWAGIVRHMKAKWEIITQTDGTLAVVYKNLIKNIEFECGACRPDTPIDLILQYIEEEGDVGDHIFHDGRWLTNLVQPVLA